MLLRLLVGGTRRIFSIFLSIGVAWFGLSLLHFSSVQTSNVETLTFTHRMSNLFNKVKIVLLGEIGSGKTSLFLQFAVSAVIPIEWCINKCADNDFRREHFSKKTYLNLKIRWKAANFLSMKVEYSLKFGTQLVSYLLRTSAPLIFSTGHEAFRAVTASHFRGADGVALVIVSKNAWFATDNIRSLTYQIANLSNLLGDGMKNAIQLSGDRKKSYWYSLSHIWYFSSGSKRC